MAKHNSHTDPKWDDMLNAYREGTITPNALHQLEKAALDDPFLFDAMEGYALYKSSSDDKHIQDLATLTPKEETKIRKINYLRWSSVAAVFLLLLAVTFFMRDQFADKEFAITSNATNVGSDDSDLVASKIDTEEEVKEQLDDAIPQMESDAKSKIEELPAPTAADVSKKKPITPPVSTSSTSTAAKPGSDISNRDKDIAQIETAPIAESPVAESFDLKEEKTQSIPPHASTVIDGEALERKRSEIPADSDFEKKEMSSQLRGQIVDQQGLPLIGASVQIENTETGTLTDIEGKFTLPTYPSGIQLVSTYTGFEPAYTMIQDDSFYNITLTESMMLDEVVVADYSIPATEKEAIPEIGYDGLEAFIEKYKNIPINAFAANYKGSVTVEFMINEDGTLSEFFSKDEGCNACINEAIRLLKLAGKWKTVPEGIKRKAVYTISF